MYVISNLFVSSLDIIKYDIFFFIVALLVIFSLILLTIEDVEKTPSEQESEVKDRIKSGFKGGFATRMDYLINKRNKCPHNWNWHLDKDPRPCNYSPGVKEDGCPQNIHMKCNICHEMRCITHAQNHYVETRNLSATREYIDPIKKK